MTKYQRSHKDYEVFAQRRIACKRVSTENSNQYWSRRREKKTPGGKRNTRLSVSWFGKRGEKRGKNMNECEICSLYEK